MASVGSGSMLHRDANKMRTQAAADCGSISAGALSRHVQPLLRRDQLEAIRRFVKAFDIAPGNGNFPPVPGVFPDYLGPIVRNVGGLWELTTVRWAMPSSSRALYDAARARAAKISKKRGQPLLARRSTSWSAMSRMPGRPMSATPTASTGGDGWMCPTAASCRSPASPSSTAAPVPTGSREA